MLREEFEEIVQDVFLSLPKIFGEKIDNVHFAIEDLPSEDVSQQTKSKKSLLLGLYQGVPLTQRGTWYGASPTVPDKITLYQKNIESVCQTEEEMRRRIKEVLLHEIGHYFGMTEDQIRNALKNY